MAPMLGVTVVDDMSMTFRNKRTVTEDCPHTFRVRTEHAGMSRAVCEACGNVSVGYVGNHMDEARAQELAAAAASFLRSVEGG